MHVESDDKRGRRPGQERKKAIKPGREAQRMQTLGTATLKNGSAGRVGTGLGKRPYAACAQIRGSGWAVKVRRGPTEGERDRRDRDTRDGRDSNAEA